MPRYIYLLIFFIMMLSAELVKADEKSYRTLSLALGTSSYNERDFRSIELRGSSSFSLFSYTDSTSKYHILPIFNLSLGSLKQNEEIDFFSTITSGITLFTLNKRVNIDAEGGFAFLTDDKIGRHDFGGYIQFALHAGIHYRHSTNLFIGYRFFHISDAGIVDGNGLNRHLVEIGYAFSY